MVRVHSSPPNPYASFEDFEAAIKAVNPYRTSGMTAEEYEKAWDEVWEAVPRKWQRRYRKKHFTSHPHFSWYRHGNGRKRMPSIVWSSDKKWYRHFFPHWGPIRPSNWWCWLSCIVNREHDVLQMVNEAHCTTCGKKVKPVDPLSKEQWREYEILSRMVEEKVKQDEPDRPPGISLPYPSNATDYETIKQSFEEFLSE